MTLRVAVPQALRLLTARDRRVWVAFAAAQAAISVLDLIGIFLLGAVGALGVTTVQGAPPPVVVEDFTAAVGLASLSSSEVLLLIAALGAGLLLLKSTLSAYLVRRQFRFLATREASVSARLANALLSKPLTFIRLRSSQQTAYALVQGAASAVLVVLGQALVFLSELSLLLVLGVFLFLLDPLIASCAVLYFALISTALQLALGRWGSRVGKVVVDTDIASLDTVQEAVSSYREISVLNRRSLYIQRIQDLRWQAARSGADMQFITTLPKYVFEVALVVGGFLLAAALFATQDAVAAVGNLVLFLAAATRIMPSLLRLQGAALSVRNASGAASSTFELAEALDYPLETPTSIHEPATLMSVLPQTFVDFTPDIRVDHVTFRYPGASEPAIRDASLVVPQGTSLALAGTSGAGKTTLADIILGVVEPQVGHVKVSSLSPGDASRIWPGAIAYVPQDVALANTSIRANIALGIPREAVDDSLVWEALERAHLAEIVAEKPDTIDALVGERGIKLSGGQRQRLGIARALYTRPRLLVLDEATSALDAETELAISSTINGLKGTVTAVIIAHRLSTIRAVDQVAYLETGRILATGTFDDVRRQVPSFDRQADIMGLPREH